jgi:hypothetical protein
MDIKDLGLTKEELAEKVVSKVASEMLYKSCIQIDEDGAEYASTESTPFNKEIQEHVKAKVEAAIAEIVDKHIMPNASNYLETIVLQKTNKWGSKIGEPVSFVEYLTERAGQYMKEEVDFQGKTKAENRGYSFNKKGTRIEYMIHQYLQYHIESWAQNALKEANNQICEGLQKAVEMKLKDILGKIKFKTEIPR